MGSSLKMVTGDREVTFGHCHLMTLTARIHRGCIRMHFYITEHNSNRKYTFSFYPFKRDQSLTLSFNKA